MFFAINKFAVLVVLVALSGCAGTNFVRPDTDVFKNGQTSYTQVVQRMGKPRREGSALKNEKELKSISYAYAETGGKPLKEGVIPARAMSFYFYNDTLVGYEFVSSWAEDSSDFDAKKISAIVKGKTTKAEVMQLLGKPSGFYVYPMMKSESGEAAAYVYSDAKGTVFNMKFFRKALVVSFDGNGVTTDVDYSSSGVE